MTALGFVLGVGYVLLGLLVLIGCEQRFGSRLGPKLEGLPLAQMTAVAVWPLFLAIDLVLVQLKPRNRRQYP